MSKKLTYTLLIRYSPNQVLHLITAYQFCELLPKWGHSINCLFFQYDAVYLGMVSPIALDGMATIHDQWQNFIKQHSLPAFICSSSALRRGIVDDYFARQNGVEANLAPMFQLDTLGTLFTAIESSDRYIIL